MIDQRTHAGYVLATSASFILLGSALAVLVVYGLTGYYTAFENRSLETLVTTTPLPALGLLIWLAGTLGTAIALLSIVVYGFRARWFWRCLVLASILWVFAAPIGTLLGLIALGLLLKNRRGFPHGRVPESVAP